MTGGADVNKGAKYILWRFTQLNRARLSIYPHLTQATDTSNVSLVAQGVCHHDLELTETLLPNCRSASCSLPSRKRSCKTLYEIPAFCNRSGPSSTSKLVSFVSLPLRYHLCLPCALVFVSNLVFSCHFFLIDGLGHLIAQTLVRLTVFVTLLLYAIMCWRLESFRASTPASSASIEHVLEPGLKQ